jgi:hypothetical protein
LVSTGWSGRDDDDDDVVVVVVVVVVVAVVAVVVVDLSERLDSSKSSCLREDDTKGCSSRFARVKIVGPGP